MVRWNGRGLGILLALGLTVWAPLGCDKEGDAFQEAQAANTIETYEGFQKAFPENDHFQMVEQRLDILYRDAAQAGGEAEQRAYLSRFPTGNHAATIRSDLETLRYRAAVDAGGLADLKAFLSEFPKGNYSKKVGQKIAVLEYGKQIEIALSKPKVAADGGQQIKATVTNGGDRALSAVMISVKLPGGKSAAVGVQGDNIAPGASLTMGVVVLTPEGWDGVTVESEVVDLTFLAEK